MFEVDGADKSRYELVSQLIYSERGDRRAEFNTRAAAVLGLMHESLPNLDEKTTFVIVNSVAFLLHSIMVTPVAKAGTEIEELFDVYTLAASSLIGVVDLNDESPAPNPDELEKKALMAEIERLRGELAKPSGGEDYRPGTYL